MNGRIRGVTSRRTTACWLCLALAMVPACATIYHIAETGDDGSPGTEAEPWATIAKANAALEPGDTVLIHAGTYRGGGSPQIRPERSGTSEDQRITYRAAGDGDVNLEPKWWGYRDRFAGGAIALGQKSYVTVDGMKIRVAERISVFGNMNGADHCIIENCDMEGPCNWGIHFGYYVLDIESCYNVFRNNRVVGTDFTEDLIQMSSHSHHNLVENCWLQDSGHGTLCMQPNLRDGATPAPHHNVIRNNVIKSAYHTAMNCYGAGEHNLIHGNILIADYGSTAERTPGTSGGRYKPDSGHSLQYSASRGIVRHNLVIRGSRAGALSLSTTYKEETGRLYLCVENRFYGNTFAHSTCGVRSADYCPADDEHRLKNQDIGRNVFVNNIIWGNEAHHGIGHMQIRFLSHDLGDIWRSNLIGDPGEKVILKPRSGTWLTLEEAEQLSADVTFLANIQGDPLFVDPGSDDYHLREGSPCVDAGAPLTTATGTGTDTDVLTVQDAGYFTDGMGIIEGDTIRIGEDHEAQIVEVVDAAHLKLDRPVSWEEGDPVSLPYVGAAPDLGAFEYTGE